MLIMNDLEGLTSEFCRGVFFSNERLCSKISKKNCSGKAHLDCNINMVCTARHHSIAFANVNKQRGTTP